MNENDVKNLNFLISVEIGVLYDWYENVQEDDHLYALELLIDFNNKKINKNLYNLSEEEEKNLEFLLTIDDTVLKDWYKKMNRTDHLYAFELLTSFKGEKLDFEIEEKLNETNQFPEIIKLLNQYK